jgi:hypothetical protein
MYDWIIVLAVAVLAFPVIAIVALVKVLGLGDLVRRLDNRVAALERRPAPAGELAPEAPRQAGLPQPAARIETTAAPTAPPPPPRPPPPPPVEASVPTTPAPAAPLPPTRAVGFEERFGTHGSFGLPVLLSHSAACFWCVSRFKRA